MQKAAVLIFSFQIEFCLRNSQWNQTTRQLGHIFCLWPLSASMCSLWSEYQSCWQYSCQHSKHCCWLSPGSVLPPLGELSREHLLQVAIYFPCAVTLVWQGWGRAGDEITSFIPHKWDDVPGSISYTELGRDGDVPSQTVWADMSKAITQLPPWDLWFPLVENAACDLGSLMSQAKCWKSSPSLPTEWKISQEMAWTTSLFWNMKWSKACSEQSHPSWLLCNALINPTLAWGWTSFHCGYLFSSAISIILKAI